MKKLSFLILIGLVAAFVFQPAGLARADSLNDLNNQIQSKQKQIDEQRKNIKTIQDLTDNLSSQIQLTQQEIDVTNNQISVTGKKIDETIVQIDQKQKELDIQKANLFETMKVMYETPQQSTIEIVVGSNSLSDIVDKSQYIESLNYQIETAMNAIMQLKAQLESQKNQLEKEKADLESQKNSLVDKKRNLNIQQEEKNRLLSQAKAAFNQALAEKDALSEKMQALLAEGGYTTGSSGGYPWAGANPNGVDPWHFYYRQCTSYAAWYWNSVLHKSWYALYPPPNGNPNNNAMYWPDLARAEGYKVTSDPKVAGTGAIISWTAISNTGHVGILQAINSDGTIDISDYNWARDGNGNGIYAYHSHLDPSRLGPYVYIY